MAEPPNNDLTSLPRTGGRLQKAESLSYNYRTQFVIDPFGRRRNNQARLVSRGEIVHAQRFSCGGSTGPASAPRGACASSNGRFFLWPYETP